MKTCIHFNCGEMIRESDLGLSFCVEHLDELYKLMEYDDYDESQFSYTLAFCLSSLNAKAYKYESTVF